jgi:SAM-dependent methyltransferase
MADDPPVVDVERLVSDLRERVKVLRAQGAYGAEPAPGALPLPPEARVRFRPELGYSSKPIVGRPLTALKRLILRLLFHVFDDLARQTDVALDQVSATLGAQVEAHGRTQADVLARVAAVETTIEHLQIAPRLARLERAPRPAPAPPPAAPSGAPPTAPAPATAALDYESFEGRFRGSETLIRERQSVYLEHLRDRRRVADLGCGRGELLALLGERGVSAYGVDSEPDFVALCLERGLDVRHEDAIAHLEGLEAGAVDALVASHVVEHLPPERLTTLVDLAADRLPEDGLLVMETPNPESLLAGSINFHRDPTHLRPVHPDTLAFLCESAGFRSVAIKLLSPVPEEERLPSAAPGEDALARHLDRIVDQLNGILYGWQDYAVLARR